MVQTYRDGKWSEPVALPTKGMEDVARCAIACDAKGGAWIAYSAQRDGNFDVYARRVTLGKKLEFGIESRVSEGKRPDIQPAMCTDAQGNPWLAWQSWDEKGQSRIAVATYSGGAWRRAITLSSAGNCWNPTLAASPTGPVALAYDVYRNGNY